MAVRIRDNWSVHLIVVFAGIVIALLTATLVTEWRLAAVGRVSVEIANDTAPSIEYLTTARSEMRHLQLVTRELVDDQGAGAATVRLQDVEDTRRGMDDALAAYLELPVTAKEQRLWGDILHARDALNVAVERCVSKVEQHDFVAADALLGRVLAAADALGTAITQTIAFNATHSHDLALEIARMQRQSRYVAGLLATLCAGITIAGGMGLRSALRRHQRLADAHRALLEARATELEQFAGRVAHDISSPLSVVLLALRRTSSPGLADGERSRLVERGTAAVKRIDSLVRGLLAFAVAGAKPQAGAHANVEATLADLAPELRAAAMEVGADVEISVHVTSQVACNPGVLTSVVSNLGFNAIKHIGDGAHKHIDIRGIETHGNVRIEVQDTGPGLLPGLEERVFEPYVRGPGAPTGGIGLGLATVKRIATAHGGTVGVESIPGRGCTFWVELPTASEGDAGTTRVGGVAVQRAT